MKLNKIVASSVGVGVIVLGLATSAQADGYAAPRAYGPALSWTGFYAGLQVDALWGSVNGSFVNPPLATWGTDMGTSGFLAGQVGYQHQFGSVVAGIEAMGSGFSGINRNFDGCHPAASCVAGGQLTGSIENFATVGGRLGWVVDPWSRKAQWMPFISGGYARAEVKNGFYTAALAVIEGTRDSVTGWYIGGGVSILAAGNWMVGVEYRHYEFGSVTSTPVTPAGASVAADRWTLDPSADTVSLSVSYKFGREPRYEALK